MVVVSPQLVKALVTGSRLLEEAYYTLLNDVEVQALWEMANVMAVKRLRYNDHGPVHAQIAAGAALYLYQLLRKKGVESTLVKDGIVDTEEEAALVPLVGALLHDVGNSVHRDNHERVGALLSEPIVSRLLGSLIDDPRKRVRLRQEILHSIYCTAYDVDCLTVEAGCVKVGDGLDMAEGRARVPYSLGNVNIHSLSALSIKSVEVLEGESSPVKILVYMDETAGVFQVDEVLMPKLKTTPLRKYVEVYAISGDRVLKTYSPS
ncbi:HD domain-containing protein [Thermogladius sp. KZ2Tp1]|uniref:HD domain-containing protein n=1 Tax=Thermogladius sp. KZ2Tp1 TaxID=3136289 RepID=UPI003DA80611